MRIIDIIEIMSKIAGKDIIDTYNDMVGLYPTLELENSSFFHKMVEDGFSLDPMTGEALNSLTAEDSKDITTTIDVLEFRPKASTKRWSKKDKDWARWVLKQTRKGMADGIHSNIRFIHEETKMLDRRFWMNQKPIQARKLEERMEQAAVDQPCC